MVVTRRGMSRLVVCNTVCIQHGIIFTANGSKLDTTTKRNTVYTLTPGRTPVSTHDPGYMPGDKRIKC